MSIVRLLILSMLFTGSISTTYAQQLFKAHHPYIQYTGRIDNSNPALPRFWAPGVYIRARFSGTSCEVILNDEMLYGKYHNAIAVQIDDQPPVKIQTTGKENVITVAKGLKPGAHMLTICKNTEAGIGYLELVGLKCDQLLKLPAAPTRKIEFIGNSITCGMGSDLTIPCGSGEWYDQHNAYNSYGPITARALRAQWQLSAVSGIGLIHSCCDMQITMPQVFDKVNMHKDTIVWDFSRYQPDVVTVTLGQNDGIQDSTLFCRAYLQFIKKLRQYYPAANIVCLNSPMADANLTAVLKKYIIAITSASGDKKVSYFFYSKRYHQGCGSHPDLAEHRLIAAALTTYLKKLKNW